MNYIEYLKAQFDGVFDMITEETNFNASGDVLVYKKMTGTNYYSSQVLPIQLEVYTQDINKFMKILLLFATENSSVTITQGFTYAKQSFQTPQVLNMWSESNENYVATLILNGTLIISDNISDVKELYIDDEFVEFSTADIVYAASADPDQKWGLEFQSSILRGGINTLMVSAINKNSALTQKIKNIRRKLIPINTMFKIKVIYIENDDTELFDMKLTGSAVSSSNENMPMNLLTFTE